MDAEFLLWLLGVPIPGLIDRLIRSVCRFLDSYGLRTEAQSASPPSALYTSYYNSTAIPEISSLFLLLFRPSLRLSPPPPLISIVCFLVLTIPSFVPAFAPRILFRPVSTFVFCFHRRQLVHCPFYV